MYNPVVVMLEKTKNILLLLLMCGLLITCSSHKVTAKTAVPTPEIDLGPQVRWSKLNIKKMAGAVADGKCLAIFLDSHFCSDCTKLTLETFSDKEVSDTLNNKFYPVKIFSHEKEFWQTARRFGINTIPALIMLQNVKNKDAEGLVVEGFIPASGLLELISDFGSCEIKKPEETKVRL